jgi:glycosyltransferase involved in cell wall biosynthesis
MTASPQRGLIVIPAYNEERNIAKVLRAIRACGYPDDVVVVNDGSVDGTLGVVRAEGGRAICHPVNLGYVRALFTGIRFALERGYDYLVFLDGDGQHDPKQVADLKACALAQGGPDVVIGSRFVKDTGYDAPLGRKLGMLLFSWLTALIGGRRIYDTTCGFKLIKRPALQILSRQIFGDFHSEMIIFCLIAGLRVEEVPVHVSEREFGTSMYGWLQSLMYPFKTSLAIAVLWLAARRERRLHAA